MPLFGYSFLDDFFKSEQPDPIRKNRMLDAYNEISDYAKQVRSSDEYKNAHPVDKKEFDDYINRTLIDLQPAIKETDNFNEALAVSNYNEKMQELGKLTANELDQTFGGQLTAMALDTGRNSYENVINQGKTVRMLWNRATGDKKEEAQLADEIMQSQLDMNAMLAPSEYDVDKPILDSQNIRNAVNAASNLEALMGSPVNVAVSKGVGVLASGIGKVTGLTAAAEKFFGAAAGTGAEGIAEAGAAMTDLSGYYNGIKLVAGDYAKGMLGFAIGKTASALPTWASMSLPELYKDSLEYDENGNVVLPSNARLARMAFIAIPHAIIENFGINPQTFGKEAEKLAFKQYFKEYFQSLFEEPSEELYQKWIGNIEKEWGKKDPTTGKEQNLLDAIQKASEQFTSEDEDKLNENIQEALGGFFGAALIFPTTHKFATSNYLKMQERYRNSLDKIAKGLDEQANQMEKMGIADFSSLRNAQKDLEEAGRLLQEQEAKLKANDFKDNGERRTCIQTIANLKREAAQISAELQDAAENCVKDYAAGIDILSNMQSDYNAQQQQIPAEQMRAENILNTSDDVNAISEAQKTLDKTNAIDGKTMEQSKSEGNFDTQKYQEEINSRIKTFKGENQLADEALKARDKVEAKNPDLKEKRLKAERDEADRKQKAIDEEKAKGKPKSREKAELDRLEKEWRNSDFQGNFNDYLRALDEEEAQAENDIQNAANQDFQNAKSEQQKKYEQAEAEADRDSADVDNVRQQIQTVDSQMQNATPEQALGLQETRQQLTDTLKSVLEKAKQSEAKAVAEKERLDNFEKSYGVPEGFRYKVNEYGNITLERDPNYKRSEGNSSTNEALKNSDQEGIKSSDKPKSKKIGNQTVYDTQKDARLAAADMLADDIKAGKVKEGTKRSDVYSVVATPYGYVVKPKKKTQTRTKTLNGKEAVDKQKAEKKIADINQKLQSRRKRNKKGKNVKVVLVEDQSELPNNITPAVTRNAYTGVLEKAATYVEGSTEKNGKETTIYIVRNNIDSEARLDSIVTHELIHAGLRNVLSRRQQGYLLHEVLRLLAQDDKFRNEILPEMSEYMDMLSIENILNNNGMNVFLEEVLARIAEKMDAESDTFTGKMKSIWNNIVSLFYRALRSLGLTTNLSKSEIPDLLKGLRFDMTGTGSLYHFTRSQYGENAGAKAMFRADNMKSAINKLAKRGDLVSYDLDGKPNFSLRTWNEGGRDVLAKWLDSAVKQGEVSRQDAKDLVAQMDEIYNTCKIMAAEDPDSEFGRWSKVGVDYDSEGKPYFTVIRQNGDYAMNIDFSTVCKKRRALNNVLNEIVKRGYLTNHGDLTQKDVVDIQEAIKTHGFEVACALCFVDSKRYNIGKQAKNIVGKWNKMYKSFSEGSDYYKQTLAEAKQQLAEGKKAKNQEQRIALAIASEEKDSDGNYKYRRPLTIDWLISSGSREMIGGHDNLAKNYPRIFEVLNGYGAGKSKNSHMDVAWNNDIIAAYNAINNPNTTSFDRQKAFDIGGVRIQSFSDFIPTMFFDYVQCISELDAKKLPCHAYTKEADFVKLFGSCGIKTNMSLVYANKGCQKISEQQYNRIKKEKGDAFVTTMKDKKGKTVYYEYLYTDLDPDHPQSFNPTEAFRLREDPRYADNCGTIAVAVSEEHLQVLLADPRIDQVIPYHKSGIAAEVAKMRQINEYVDFTKRQTERDNKTGFLINDKKDEHKAALKKSGAYGKHFDFYGDLAETQDPRQTAKNYKQWCKKNDLSPKFSEYIDNDNYYKLLADFKLYKQDAEDNDVYIPQQAVKLKMNDDYQQVLQNALDVNQKIADRFNGDIDSLLNDCKQILDGNKEMAKKSKSAAKSTGKKAVKFNKKKGTYTVADNIDKAKVKAVKPSSIFKTNKKTGVVKLKTNVRYSIVKDPKTIDWFNNSKKIKTIRMMQRIGDSLYPPMAKNIEGRTDPIKVGDIIKADENPNITRTKIRNGKVVINNEDQKNGIPNNPVYEFLLDKGDGTSIWANYDPYLHAVDPSIPINDQITVQYARENLVWVEMEVSEDDLNEHYRADKSYLPTGIHGWKTNGVLAEKGLYLTRYGRVNKVLSNNEVASRLKDLFKKGTIKEAIPFNILTPSLREELKKMGVPVSDRSTAFSNIKGGNFLYLQPDGSIKAENGEVYYSNGMAYRDSEGNIKYIARENKATNTYRLYDIDGNLVKAIDSKTGREIPRDTLSKKILKTKIDKTRYSLKSSDQQYFKALSDGDIETAQRMVDEAAKEAMPNVVLDYKGLPLKVWHGGTFIKNGEYIPRTENGFHLGTIVAAIQRVTKMHYGTLFGTDSRRFGKDFDDGLFHWAYYETGSDIPTKISEEGYEEREDAYKAAFKDYFGYNIGEAPKGEIDVRPYFIDGKDILVSTSEDDPNEYDFKRWGLEWSPVMEYENAVEDAGSYSYKISEPNRIKSADPVTYDDKGEVIPLSQRFDTENKDIRYSLRNADGSKKTNQELWKEQQAKFVKILTAKRNKEAQKRSLKENIAYMLDRAEYNFANRRLYLKKWQTELEESLADNPDFADLFENGRLKDEYDVHMLFDTVDGKTQTKRDKFVEDYWNPINDLITENGVKYDDLNRFLFARHADERDEHVAQINPEFANGGHGSGWKDEWGTPNKVIHDMKKKYGKEVMNEIGEKFDELNDKLLDYQVQYHLMSEETAKKIRERYEHYTPLKRFDDYIRNGQDTNAEEINIGQDISSRAMGRTSTPEHMLTFVKANIDTVFRRGERNLIKLAMLNLALKVNDPVIEVDRKLVKRTINKDGEVDYVRDLSSDREQTIGVRDGDKYYTIHIGNKEIYDAFVSDDMRNNELFEAIVSSFRGITQTMGANATSRNIEFGLVNLDKDQQQALAENLVYRSKKGDFWNFAKNAIKNIPSAAKTFLQFNKGIKNEDTKMFQEFLDNGGTTGYTDIYKLTDDAKDLEARIDEATMGFFEKWSKWKRQGKITANLKAKAKEVTAKLLKPLEFVNELFEQTTRFANYKTARKFMSAQRAAELSKNLTLNFNRHGKMWGSQWNWMYMFSNASLQGTVKTVRMYEKAFSDKATPEQKKAARSILTMAFTAGVMAEILNHAFSGDDDDELKYYDKLESSIKDNNVIIMNPASKTGKNYIKLPLFIGAAFPYMMGRNAAAMMTGTQSTIESVGNVVQNMEDYFSPLGSAAPNKEGKGDVVKRIAPTALRPFLDVSYNSNFAGSRIYANSMNSNKPAYTRAFKKTPMMYVSLSRILSNLTGGNTLEKGYIDIPPEAIQHIAETYSSGTGKFVGRTIETGRKLIKGEELDAGNLPIIRRFTDDVGDSYVYDEYRRIEEAYRTINTAVKNQDKQVLEKYPKYKNLVNVMSRFKPRLNDLDKKLEKNRISMDDYRKQYIDYLKQINKDGRKYLNK